MLSQSIVYPVTYPTAAATGSTGGSSNAKPTESPDSGDTNSTPAGSAGSGTWGLGKLDIGGIIAVVAGVCTIVGTGVTIYMCKHR